MGFLDTLGDIAKFTFPVAAFGTDLAAKGGKALGKKAGFLGGKDTADPRAIDASAFVDPRLQGRLQQIRDIEVGLRESQGQVGQQQGQFRGQQQDLINAISQRARGEGPSVAEQQLARSRDQNLNQLLALQATQRGATNPAIQQRQLQRHPDALDLIAGLPDLSRAALAQPARELVLADEVAGG